LSASAVRVFYNVQDVLKEIYRNHWRCWPKIVLGPISYTPPVEIEGEY
jgi:hypothetical protein